MPLTVRLDPKIERVLDKLARTRRQTRSAVVREAIEHYQVAAGTGAAECRPYELWEDAIGVVRLGVQHSRQTTGELFGELVQRKARARRPR